MHVDGLTCHSSYKKVFRDQKPLLNESRFAQADPDKSAQDVSPCAIPKVSVRATKLFESFLDKYTADST
jgi:hypothetical protein